MRILIATLAAAFWLFGPGLPSADAGARGVALSPEEIARLGVETTPAEAIQFTPELRGYGFVSNLINVVQANSDIRTAEAAVTDSDAALARAEHLFAIQAISAQQLDAAKHAAATNRAVLVLADRKEVATYGLKAPWRGPPRDEAELDNLSDGRSALIQTTFPLGIAFSGPPPTLIIERLDPQPGQTSWTSRVTWDAPADPTIPGRSFFALVDGSTLAQGEHVLVFAPIGAPLKGVRVPSDAVILSEDKSWCYVAVTGRQFVRVPVDLRLQVAGGYFVEKTIAPGQPIVVKGTGLLLAREFGMATPGRD